MSRREIDALVDEVLRAEREAQTRTQTQSALRQPAGLVPVPGPVPVPLSAAPTRPAPIRRRARRRRWPWVLLALVALALRLGLDYTVGHTASAGTGDLLGGLPAQPTRYTDGSYRFMDTQPGNPDVPIGYNPCRRILVEINYAHATPDILALTRATMRQINQVSGLHLVYAGASQRYRTNQGTTGRILISFNDIPHDDALQDAAGIGGSGYSYLPGEHQTVYYTGGEITLNTAEFNHYPRSYQALVLAHEFGHTLGLDHASGHEVMASGDYSVDAWGHGDLTGLATLGALPCR